jgi:1-acyl-sn-glycerol-3-phosphate acyltransferase
MHLIPVPPQVPRRGSAACRLLGRVVLKAMGWDVEGQVPDLPKFVIAVAPHTSNWDFIVGVAAMFALDLRLAFIGKHTLFAGPIGPLMRWLGGIPVDRSAAHGVVAQSVAGFTKAGSRILVIAPEGTRRKVDRFKSGFLHIAKGAGVPVVLAALDYGTKRVRLGPVVEPGADIEADRVRIEAYFAPIRGRRPR